MSSWLIEKLAILAYSGRTQSALVMGVVSFIAAHLVGYMVLNNFEMPGVFGPLTEPLKELFQMRYDRVAWGGLLGFWALAFKFYKQDAKKFDKLF